MKPFSIRILAGRLSPGVGSHNYNRELASRLAARGHHVSVICFEASPDLRGVVDQLEIPRKGYAEYSLIWRWATWLEWMWFNRELARRPLKPVDVVIAAEHLFLKAHAKRFPSTPIVYLPHSLLVIHEIESYHLLPTMHKATLAVYSRVQRWALRHAAATMRFTQAACDMLQAEYPTIAPPCFVVNPIGVDLPAIASAQRPDIHTVRLLYSGQLVPGKRIEFILNALASLRDRDWTLDIVGEGPSRVTLEALTTRLDLADRVRFRGHQKVMDPWYRQADLLVLTSRSESLGLVLVEAMSYGVPCLGLKSDGVATWNVNDEIIEHGRTGLIADGEAGFRRELEAVLQRPERLAALGRAARQHVAQHLSWDPHIQRYETLFEQLVTDRQTRSSSARP